MLGILYQIFKDIFFFAGYVGTNGSFPDPLQPEEERACLQRLMEGDSAARTMLIEHNLRLVAHIAKKYAGPRRDQDDLISIGTVGLIKAVSTFDPCKNSALATYAARCIENEILMSLRAEKKQSGEISLSEPIGVDGDGNEISLADILGSEPDQVQRDVESRIAFQQVRSAVEDALCGRERTVIKLRYGLMNGRCMPQREVAALLGISRSYVSRLEKKAVGKLNAYLGQPAPVEEAEDSALAKREKRCSRIEKAAKDQIVNPERGC